MEEATEPSAHTGQTTDAPTAEEAVPAAHGVHSAEPKLSAYAPAGQAAHCR